MTSERKIVDGSFCMVYHEGDWLMNVSPADVTTHIPPPKKSLFDAVLKIDGEDVDVSVHKVTKLSPLKYTLSIGYLDLNVEFTEPSEFLEGWAKQCENDTQS